MSLTRQYIYRIANKKYAIYEKTVCKIQYDLLTFATDKYTLLHITLAIYILNVLPNYVIFHKL